LCGSPWSFIADIGKDTEFPRTLGFDVVSSGCTIEAVAGWNQRFVICVLALSPASGQTAREYLDRVANTYKHLKSFQVEAEAERGRADQASDLKVAITLYTTPPNRARIETKDANRVLRSVLIANGSSMIEYTVYKQQYSSFEGRLTVSFDPERGIGLGEMLYDTISNGVTETSIRGRQTLVVGKDRIRCVVVNAKYGNSARAPNYSFWIAKTGLIFRRAVTYWDGREVRTVVSTVLALTVNESLPEETFEFQPPPGVKETPPPNSPAILAAR